MIPILYKKGASNYSNNGIGHLKDAISCKVTEERHGDYLLTLQYPISGAWYSDIVEGAVVKAKANETSELQLFRIYKSSKPMKGVVTFYGEHISYDLKGLPLCALSMRGTTPGAALTAGFSASVLSHGFTAWSDITTLNNINITKPRSLRNFCGGEAGSVLSVWGGEFEFDNFVVKLHKHRGANNGVVINYGKNLTDAKQERNISDCYTHFCPYAIKKTETRNAAGEVTETSEETITLSDGVIEIVNPENIGHTKAYTLDISDKFADGEEMNEANLRAHAEEYIASHKLGVPKVNITLSFMQIWDSPEYSKIAVFERVALCDTVTVRFSDLGIDAEAKVIKTEYDSLEERFSKIEVGDAKSTLADTVTSIEESITDTKKSLTESENAASVALQNAIIEATNKITGNSGGYVVLSPANNPQEILIMNTPDKETATRVWRWNSSGLGYSKSGYNGEYGLAMTMDGAIVADFITAGTLNAINITGCTITGGSLNINDRFTVDAEGNVRTEGEIIATSGIIGGCEIKDGKLVITSANITGTLTIGQLPDSVAETSDIPTKVSELSNDSGYQNRTGVVSIIDGRITADYVEALEISVAAANITGKLTASQINADGISASDVTISGAITATSGSVENMTIKGKLTFGGNSSYYINANYNDGSYYINLPGFKVDDASGAVFSGKLSAATGSFSGSITTNNAIITGGKLSFGTEGNKEYASLNDSRLKIGWEYGNTVVSWGDITLTWSEWFENTNVLHVGSYSDDGMSTSYGIRANLDANDSWYWGISCYEINSMGYAGIGFRMNKNSYSNNYGELSGTWKGTLTATSDGNLKHDIENLSEKYSLFFDKIRPVRFKFNNGSSDRFHTGFIAQEIERAILESGLTTQEAALFVRFVEENPKENTQEISYGLRYDEFISLCVYEIQKLKNKLSELESLTKA